MASHREWKRTSLLSLLRLNLLRRVRLVEHRIDTMENAITGVVMALASCESCGNVVVADKTVTIIGDDSSSGLRRVALCVGCANRATAAARVRNVFHIVRTCPTEPRDRGPEGPWTARWNPDRRRDRGAASTLPPPDK